MPCYCTELEQIMQKSSDGINKIAIEKDIYKEQKEGMLKKKSKKQLLILLL